MAVGWKNPWFFVVNRHEGKVYLARRRTRQHGCFSGGMAKRRKLIIFKKNHGFVTR
jgi:hypothetical protein